MFSTLVLGLNGCKNAPEDALPVYNRPLTEGQSEGPWEELPSFKMTDQQNREVTEADIKGKIHIVDFFFTSCPTICPKMKSQMLRVLEAFNNDPQVVLLSHTIDPDHDTVEVLADYANRLGIKGDQWRFLTGNKDSTYNLAEAYMVSAMSDPNAPGGYIHSGALILVDKNRHIRGYFDGTSKEATDKLIAAIKVLQKEK